MHPVDLIRDSSISVRQKFKFNGVPDAIKSPQGKRHSIMNDFKSLKPISVYSTKQAVDDGFLILVDPKVSQEAGIRHPVYLTCAVWDKYVEVPEEMEGHQDPSGRLWDVLFMFVFFARKESSSHLLFKLLVQLPDTDNWEQNEKVAERSNRLLREVTLKALITSRDFDDPSPAIFIMKPFED